MIRILNRITLFGFALITVLSAAAPARADHVFRDHCSRLLSFGLINHQYLTRYDEYCKGGSCANLMSDELLNQTLLTSLSNPQENPRVRMRIAAFVRNYPGYSPEQKKLAGQVIEDLLHRPEYKSLRGDLDDIEKRSLFYVEDQEVSHETVDRLYAKLDRMASNVASGKRAGNQLYTEVLPDSVIASLRAHHTHIENLEKLFRKISKQTTQGKTADASETSEEALVELKALLADDFIGKNDKALSQRLQEFQAELEAKSFEQHLYYREYFETLESKLKEFLLRADPELVGLVDDAAPAERVHLRSIFKGLMRGKKSGLEAYVEFRQWLDQYAEDNYSIRLLGHSFQVPGISYLLRRADEVSDLVQNLVFGKMDKQYLSGKSVAMGNDGVTDYLKRLLIDDPALRRMSIRFYLEVERLTPLTKNAAHPYSFWDKTEHDLWKLALESTKENPGAEPSPLHAMRVLSVFGHNDFVENFDITPEDLTKLSADQQKSTLRDFSLLNHLRPDRNSVLYAPEAIPGLNLPEKTLADMKSYQELLRTYYDRFPTLYKDAYMEDFVLMKMFRSGYYHFYGGSYITSEFMANRQTRILGLNIPVTLSLAMGYYYKMITMQETYLDAAEKFLFQEMNYRERQVMKDAELQAYLEKVNARLTELQKKPWTLEQLMVNKLSLDINILHLEITAYQHVTGADWAYEVLRKKN